MAKRQKPSCFRANNPPARGCSVPLDAIRRDETLHPLVAMDDHGQAGVRIALAGRNIRVA